MKKNTTLQKQPIHQTQHSIIKEQLDVFEEEELQRKITIKKESYADHSETDTHSQAKYYYNMVFSSYYDNRYLKPGYDPTQSIDNPYDDMDYIAKTKYEKKKQKAEKLQIKESEQMKNLEQVFSQDEEKYNAIIDILKFFTELKQKVKVDYYSHKTFMAIKSSSSSQLIKMLDVLKRIYYQARRDSDLQQDNTFNQQKQYQLIRQFLIIPRFLISRQKIQDFVNYQQVQDSFKFLVQKLCLGHQNNEANKKMPDTQLMSLLRDLLEKQNGKEIFKTICSINHGNKYRLDRGNTAYIQLFFKDLEQLRKIDRDTKKQYKRNDNPNSISRSKSHYSSDEEFDPIPQRKKSKSKLKSGHSLQVQKDLLFVEEPIQRGGKLGIRKHTQSMNLNIKLEDQFPSAEPHELLPPIRLQFKYDGDEADLVSIQQKIKVQQMQQLEQVHPKQQVCWSFANKLLTNILIVSPTKVKSQNLQENQ